VQAAIGAEGALAFDLTAACSGFVVGLVNGVHFIRGGEYKNVLVIGADVLSRYVDWRDRGTCILFGDGCGAMVGWCTLKLVGTSVESTWCMQSALEAVI
jgi:3-oxoacyl-[acyl-carrier-protein] synthase-3